MSRPLVSVVTLTYNQQGVIRECLDSVLAQTVDSWEQVIIDDESSDDTQKILAEYRDPRIRVIRQRRQGIEGLPGSYQKAVSMCTGQYVAFADGDDYWAPTLIERLLPAFDDAEVVVSYGRTQKFGNIAPDKSPLIPSPFVESRFPRGTLFNTPVGSGTRAMLDPFGSVFSFPLALLIRKSTLDRMGGLTVFPGLSVMDYPTLLLLTLEGRFHFVDEVLGYWRIHSESVTSRRYLDVQLNILRFLDEFQRTQAARLDLTEAEWVDVIGRREEYVLGLGKEVLGTNAPKEARAIFSWLYRHARLRETRAVALACLVAFALRLRVSRSADWHVRRRLTWMLK